MIGERKKERTGGDGGKSEGGSQALARPVMIDWLAGSQQTDVRPPDQPIHPRANPPLLPDPTVHHVSSCFLSRIHFLFLSLFHLEQPLPPPTPKPSALEHRLAQKARNTMHKALSLSRSLLFLSFPPPSIPHSHVSLFFRGPPNTLPAILRYRNSFNPFSTEARSQPPWIPCVTYVQKVGIAR